MYKKEIERVIKAIGLENLDPVALEIMKKQMEKDLKTGVENGYSVEFQVALILTLKTKTEMIDSIKETTAREIEIALGIRDQPCQHCNDTGEIPIPEHGIAACPFCQGGA